MPQGGPPDDIVAACLGTLSNIGLYAPIAEGLHADSLTARYGWFTSSGSRYQNGGGDWVYPYGFVGYDQEDWDYCNHPVAAHGHMLDHGVVAASN